MAANDPRPLPDWALTVYAAKGLDELTRMVPVPLQAGTYACPRCSGVGLVDGWDGKATGCTTCQAQRAVSITSWDWAPRRPL